MFMKPGDVVTMSINPSIQLVEYKLSVKPGASIQRELSENIEDDLKEMEDNLSQLLYRSLAIQLGEVPRMLEAFDEGGIPELLKLCMEEVGDVAKKKNVRVAKKLGGKKAGKKPTKKGG